MVRLPAQPGHVSWPTESWPEAAPGPGVDAASIERCFAHAFAASPPDDLGETHATLLVHHGAIVAERYGNEGGVDRTMPSWSMAKSMLHALIGILGREGRLDISAPADVPAWRSEGEPRADITVDQLLRMSSGLGFLEDYVDAERSDAIEMLFGAGKADVAGYAQNKPLEHPVDTVFSYSSGSSNVVSGIVRRRLGDDAETYRKFLHAELFERLGMRSVEPRFDEAGTWIGSSFAFATARDFARFGLLYLRDGLWEGQRVLPEGWVDYARTPTPTDPERGYGAHWWLSTDGSAVFAASGYRGQYIVIAPERDLIVVRLGDSMPEQRGAVYLWLRELTRAFPLIEAP